MNWTEMKPAEFDASRVKGKRAREVVASARGTLFPDLMPPDARKVSPVPAQLPGQADLFGEDA